MDSHCFGYSAADFSYSSYPIPSSLRTKLFESLKFESRNSPNSPLSAYFETDRLAAFDPNPIDHLSDAQPSPNSTADYNRSYLQQSVVSPFSQQDSRSFLLNASNSHSVRHTLLELESALMAVDDDGDEATTTSSDPRPPTPRSRSTSCHSETPSDSQFGSTSTQIVHNERHHQKGGIESLEFHGLPPNYNLRQLLIACAEALSENRSVEFEKLVEHTRAAVSITGEPIQRLGAYMLEGLIARKESSGTNIYRALKCNKPDSKDLLSYMHILYEICPYLKFGYMAANGAIAEACKYEDIIHIIDFQIAQGTQWMTLLQALAARPSGTPRVRITGIDDPMSKHARGDGLAAVGKRLAAVSEKYNIPVEFHAVPVFAPDVTLAMLDVRPGEALAVNFPLQLHHTPDESVDVSNPRDGLLRMVKSLSPKVVTLVEQESNTNTAPFLSRFNETLDYYSAMFESIDVTMARDRKERISVEQHCLARDIVNIIACEGKERVERHELLGKWRRRFMMAGFRPFPLNAYVNSVIRELLKCYSEHYTMVEKDGTVLLGWKNRNLVSASAWN